MVKLIIFRLYIMLLKAFLKKNIIENLFFYLVNLEKLLFDVE